MFFEYAQPVAIVVIQPPEVAFLPLGQLALQAVVPPHRRGWNNGLLPLGWIASQPLADLRQRVGVAQVPLEPEESLLARWLDRDVLSNFVGIAHSPEGIKKLPLRLGSGNGLVNI